MLGEVVGNYRIVDKIATGGVGVVYRAEHELIGKPAAVKLLRPELSEKRSVIRRFFLEARATTGIQHPGIIEIFDFGYHTDGRAYIVMEFLAGETLKQRLRRVGTLEPAHAVAIARGVASAVGAAHERGVIHRDLKPDNIFLVPDRDMPGGERVKVLDFGLAKLSDDQGSVSATRTGAVLGTPTYMAPEQCRGTGEVDHRADMYALGCILFELLCGRPPFVSPGVGELIGSHIHAEPPRPCSLRADIPTALERVVITLLAKKPEDRYATMDAVRDALDAPLPSRRPPTIDDPTTEIAEPFPAPARLPLPPGPLPSMEMDGRDDELERFDLEPEASTDVLTAVALPSIGPASADTDAASADAGAADPLLTIPSDEHVIPPPAPDDGSEARRASGDSPRAVPLPSTLGDSAAQSYPAATGSFASYPSYPTPTSIYRAGAAASPRARRILFGLAIVLVALVVVWLVQGDEGLAPSFTGVPAGSGADEIGLATPGIPEGTDPAANGADGADGRDDDDRDGAGDADADGTDPDGTDPDGADPDGTDPDGTAADGTAADGPDPDGTDPDGTAADGTAADADGADDTNGPDGEPDDRPTTARNSRNRERTRPVRRAPTTVRVRLAITPATAADILVDGQSARGRVLALRRGQRYQIEVRAAGYRPYRTALRPTRDRVLAISLTPLAPIDTDI